MAQPIQSSFNSNQIRSMMEDVKRQIELKKQMLAERQQVGQLNMPSLPQMPSIPSFPGSSIGVAADIRAQIQARAVSRFNNDGSNDASSKSSKPAPLILDQDGRTIDQSGKEVQLFPRLPTLKANIRSQKKEPIVKLTSQERSSGDSIIESKFVDPRVEIKPPVRRKREFKFYEKGFFTSIAEKERKKAKLEQLQEEIAVKAKKTGIAFAARQATLSSIVPRKETREDDVPDVEWWDSVVMNGVGYEECLEDDDDQPLDKKFPHTTNLIEHPMQMKPPSEPQRPVVLPVFLTKKEQKKLRRQNRREAWKEKQEKIRLGLEPPPEPKVKMSNMMRVLGQQAIQDPTKIEAQVREQMAKRQKAHEEANASRKLTVEQKRSKRLKKWREDTSLGVHVCVYRILNLSHPAKKFKVEMNAKSLGLRGVVVLYKNINVVVVEGGPKQQKKFKRLMMNRIKWEEENASKEEPEDGERQPNKCYLVWEGIAKKEAFGEIKFKNSPNESFARELFKNHGVEHYWDAAYSQSILES
ncbi:pre-mRNA processing factor 3 [Brevipalpus obovatus]|uniref:pre-mRNA processing factor 3 n=1 Tax=Brevipalpus obovatus TaxID=246614 RepID=UPI003D9F267B